MKQLLTFVEKKRGFFYVGKKSDKSRTQINNISLSVEIFNKQGNKKMLSWEQAMEAFLFWKKAQGVSETTLKGYSNHIKHFYNKFEHIK